MTTLDAKIDCAEQLLYELAAVLRAVPVEERTKDLHVRALELKRDVAAWRGRRPSDETCDAILDELEGLVNEARAQRDQGRVVSSRFRARTVTSSPASRGLGWATSRSTSDDAFSVVSRAAMSSSGRWPVPSKSPSL